MLIRNLRFILPNEICDQGITHLGRFIFTVGGLPSNLLKMLEVIIYSLHRIVLAQHSVVTQTKYWQCKSVTNDQWNEYVQFSYSYQTDSWWLVRWLSCVYASLGKWSVILRTSTGDGFCVVFKRRQWLALKNNFYVFFVQFAVSECSHFLEWNIVHHSRLTLLCSRYELSCFKQ